MFLGSRFRGNDVIRILRSFDQAQDRFHPLIPSTLILITRWIPISTDGGNGYRSGGGLGLPTGGGKHPFFVRQVALILKEDPTNVSREMAKLEELGILRSKRTGNLKHFQTNQECPFFEELKGLVLKTSGVAGRIHR